MKKPTVKQIAAVILILAYATAALYVAHLLGP
jgi:hypothetical protein